MTEPIDVVAPQGDIVTDQPTDFEVGGLQFRAHQDGTIEQLGADGAGIVLPPDEATRVFDAWLAQGE